MPATNQGKRYLKLVKKAHFGKQLNTCTNIQKIAYNLHKKIMNSKAYTRR
jgi:hypothetical protein